MVIKMNLRRLKKEDASLMLEWMHDKSVVSELAGNFEVKTIEDCQNFISDSLISKENYHLAIVDDNDEYMGTVSLKNISKEYNIAEFAITIRKTAMGKGYSKYGMCEILRIGKEELKLDNIYWCVTKTNARAVRFYDKNNYTRAENVPEYILKYYSEKQLESFLWYKY